MDSWSKYRGIIAQDEVDEAYSYLRRSNEIGQMMKVVGEEGTSLEDYVIYQKGEFLDAVYMQQNSFDPVDATVSVDRQISSFEILLDILRSDFALSDKKEARTFFNDLRQRFLDWNGTAEDDARFAERKSALVDCYKGNIR